jgi:predicted TPR repeat methyltransferase
MHLLNALDYKVPQLLQKTLSSFLSKSQKLDILDLGCGTGLCGEQFKLYANSLTGVDLSPNMLAVAAQKHIYNTLKSCDLTEFLTDKIKQYDLILAGDVLVYIGDLSTLFQLASRSLRPHGLFAFNAEICADADFKMNQSGRFSHSKDYLETTAINNHFKIVHYESVITRQQNNEPVYGHLTILRLL